MGNIYDYMKRGAVVTSDGDEYALSHEAVLSEGFHRLEVPRYVQIVQTSAGQEKGAKEGIERKDSNRW